MANTPSNMLALGTVAPDFTLTDTISDKILSLQNLKGNKATVVFFICNHCPFVIHVNKELVNIATDFKSRGIGFVAISSNDIVHYPQDRPELMKKVAQELHYPFPYLYDESQRVARSFDAACTPDTFVFDKDLKLVYRGQIDGSRPGNNVPVTGEDVRNALQNLLENKEVSKDQKPSIGCNIKWKQV